MFSLIITIISIALVAALAVATIYYGGDAFNQGSSKANASTMVNHAQQIAGGNTMLRATTGEYAAAASVTESHELFTKRYLASVPALGNVVYTTDDQNVVRATGTALTDEICLKVEEVAGREKTELAGVTDDDALLDLGQFGCEQVGTTNTFFFRG